MNMIKRGELYFADLNPVIGSEQGGVRPVLVIQNDVGNQFSPTVIVAAVTSQIQKARLPTHIEVGPLNEGLTMPSVVLAEQVRTIDKRRLQSRLGYLSEEEMSKVSEALRISLFLDEEAKN